MAKNSLEIESKVSNKKNGKASTPAYFLSLTVENVRCFGPRQTLDLSDGNGQPSQWTLVLGNNGVGKTTLLQCLSLLTPKLDPLFGKFLKSLGKLDTQNSNQFLYPRAYDLRFKSFRESSHRNDKSTLNLSAVFSTRTKLNERKSEGITGESYFIEKHDKSAALSAIKDELLKDFVCFGYGASRRMGETSLSEKNEDDPFTSLFVGDVGLLNAEEWLLQADYAASKPSHIRKRAAKRRNDIKDVLINLLPDVEDIRFVQLTEEQPKPSVEVKTPYGWVSIKDLSLGYKTLIAWMVDLASRLFDRYPNSPNPLAEPAVVLVDEIDLHLHPKWQRNLMSFLSERFPNTQFIATAHSPLVVQAATDANIVLLRREGDHVIIDNNVKAIQGWRVDQDRKSVV